MPIDSLSEVQEQILLTLWKLSEAEHQPISQDKLGAELSVTSDALIGEIRSLKGLGFVDGGTEMTLTPLGLAILRQIEEDKLHELG
jgi:Mn-dependent DtxR family transcriptional regulator